MFASPDLNLADFHQPGAAPRIAPFWFWNGAMDATTVRRQVAQMSEAGIGGFFIHPRQGLTLPYLSREWFARVRVAVEAAHAAGMQVWLYDEYPYPSGIAGGLVTANHPEYRARVLEQSYFDASAPLRREFTLGRLVSALACPVEAGAVQWERGVDIRGEFGVVLTRPQFWLWPMGHIPYNEKRFMSDEGRLVLEWTPPPGEWRVFVGIEKEQRGFKYYDCFFDPLQPGAAAEFIRLTHEGYAESVGEFFGTTIPGIFTDETEPPHWSPVIEAEAGLDMAELLPALRHDDHPRATEVRRQWRACALRLFQERWEAPIAQWCREHGLLWGAEKPTLRPVQFWGVAQPSTDAGHRRIGLPPEPLTADLRANHRVAIAATEQMGTEEVRCECFHSLGWGATLQDQKWSIDWLTVQGVNRLTPHAFYATSSGLQKHDAAPSFFAENPYWAHFRALADYTGRLSLAMSAGREVARLAVLTPTQALWSGGDIAKRARQEFETIQNTLLAQHFPFHPVDALALTQAEARDGGLELGHTRYETLIVPEHLADDEEANVAVRRATEAGLAVIRAGQSDWLKQLGAKRTLSVAQNGRECEAVWALWRETGTQQLVFLANTSDAEVTGWLEVVSQARAWEAWGLEDGESAPYPAESSADVGRTRLPLRLPAFGSLLLVGTVGEAKPVAWPAPPKTLRLSTEGEWELSLDRPNALRLNRWRVASEAGEWARVAADDSNWNETPALPLRYLDQTQRRWVAACERREGTPVWYRRRVEVEWVPDDLAVLVEPGAILGDWTLYVNGVQIGSDQFQAREYNGADKIAAFIAAHFRVGENLLALRIENAPELGGLVTPLHLLGNFGLGGAARRTLVPLPKTVPFHDPLAAGLPHYSGVATYRRRVSTAPLAGVEALELPSDFGDIAELRVGGVELGVRAWSPYRWVLPTLSGTEIEVELTVTNTLLPFVEGCRWDHATQKMVPV